jgi:hypothetical protein
MDWTKRLAVWSVLVGTIVLGLKYFAYYLAGSIALYSDALESIVNVARAFAALFAVHVSAKPADAGHPFGHSKVEYFSAVIEGVLIVVAAVSILRQAYLGLLIRMADLWTRLAAQAEKNSKSDLVYATPGAEPTRSVAEPQQQQQQIQPPPTASCVSLRPAGRPKSRLLQWSALVRHDPGFKRVSAVHQEIPRPGHAKVTSSVQTMKLTSVLGPNVVLIATSIASRPLAISTRPIRGTLFLGSKRYQRPPIYASNQAAKSPGPWGGGTPLSPR